LVIEPRRKRSAAPEGGAKILIFTGVRYERAAPVKPGTSSDPAKPRRKRG
jgi:hypothetical protein